MLSSPGDNDITCDVDFSSLKEECNLVPGIKAHGPISQSLFLQNMGIAMRLKMLLTSSNNVPNSSCMTSDQRRLLIKGVERLVGGKEVGGMGEIYKFLAITDQQQQPPYSF